MKLLKQIIGVLSFLPVMALADQPQNQDAPPLFFTEAHLGISNSSEHGFETSGVGQFAIGTRIKQLDISVGYSKFEDMDTKSSLDTYIALDGFYMDITKRFALAKRFLLGPQFGVMRWRATPYLNDYQIGYDNGTSMMLGISGQIKFLDNFALNINLQYINDVSGQDMHLVSPGLILRF